MHDQFRGDMEIYNPTKYFDLIWFCFQDMSVESEEEEQLIIIVLYIYDAKDHGNPYHRIGRLYK